MERNKDRKFVINYKENRLDLRSDFIFCDWVRQHVYSYDKSNDPCPSLMAKRSFFNIISFVE